MATANASNAAAAVVAVAVMDPSTAAAAAEDAAAKAAHKRYEGLVTVRTKAIKGKGAWYWAHLEPVLVHSPDTGMAKAVKLRCSLCDAVFSASNPSRTASEHLKRGTCPHFAFPPGTTGGAAPASAAAVVPKPISTMPPSSSSHHHHHHHSSSGRKRSHHSSYHPLALIDPSRPAAEVVYSSSSTPPPQQQQSQQQHQHQQQHQPTPPPHQHHQHQQHPHLVLSGGKDDLGALAMLENSVKKLKSPKASPGPALPKPQADSALALLSDWFYESCGPASFSSVDHPKFRAFLHQVGLPPISRRELAGSRLDARYDDARADAEARIRDASFFQLASRGWNCSDSPDALVGLTVNLPNGASVFRRAVLAPARAPSKFAQDILSDAVADLCGGFAERCAGIVADRFKSKALLDLEKQHQWMVNLSCQLYGFKNLLKDFARHLPLFRSATVNAFKLATFLNTAANVRALFHKFQLQDFDRASLLRLPSSLDPAEAVRNFDATFAMLDDVRASLRPIQMTVLDESYKLMSLDDRNAAEMAEMVQDRAFWNDLEAIHSLVKLVRDMVKDMEVDRPLVGQCMPLWNELRRKVKEWCDRFEVSEDPVRKLVEERFKKNYHPAWAAAFILDPLYLVKDASGKYLPPFKCLTAEQEKDVDRLIMRLVTSDEAHIALMELMKWRAEGLDPVYAQAVQVKQLDPMTGKMRVANPQSSRIVWETNLSEYKLLVKVASRIIFLQATSCGFKCNLPLLRWVCTHGRSRAGMDRAQKLVFVAAHAKLERRDFSNDEDKDSELFAADREDDVLNEPFVEAASV